MGRLVDLPSDFRLTIVLSALDATYSPSANASNSLVNPLVALMGLTLANYALRFEFVAISPYRISGLPYSDRPGA